MPRGVPKDGKSRSVKPKSAINQAKKAGTLKKQDYSNNGVPAKYTAEWIEEEANHLRKWIADGGGNYLGSFARERGYHRQRLSEFVKVSTAFADAYREAQQWQEEKFIMNALTRAWDPGFTAKVMSRVCTDEWKSSFDREESDKDITVNVNVNRIQD